MLEENEDGAPAVDVAAANVSASRAISDNNPTWEFSVELKKPYTSIAGPTPSFVDLARAAAGIGIKNPLVITQDSGYKWLFCFPKSNKKGYDLMIDRAKSGLDVPIKNGQSHVNLSIVACASSQEKSATLFFQQVPTELRQGNFDAFKDMVEEAVTTLGGTVVGINNQTIKAGGLTVTTNDIYVKIVPAAIVDELPRGLLLGKRPIFWVTPDERNRQLCRYCLCNTHKAHKCPSKPCDVCHQSLGHAEFCRRARPRRRKGVGQSFKGRYFGRADLRDNGLALGQGKAHPAAHDEASVQPLGHVVPQAGKPPLPADAPPLPRPAALPQHKRWAELAPPPPANAGGDAKLGEADGAGGSGAADGTGGVNLGSAAGAGGHDSSSTGSSSSSDDSNSEEEMVEGGDGHGPWLNMVGGRPQLSFSQEERQLDYHLKGKMASALDPKPNSSAMKVASDDIDSIFDSGCDDRIVLSQDSPQQRGVRQSVQDARDRMKKCRTPIKPKTPVKGSGSRSASRALKLPNTATGSNVDATLVINSKAANAAVGSGANSSGKGKVGAKVGGKGRKKGGGNGSWPRNE